MLAESILSSSVTSLCKRIRHVRAEIPSKTQIHEASVHATLVDPLVSP